MQAVRPLTGLLRAARSWDYFGIHGHHQAFLRGPAGQFAPLQIPGAHSSYAYGINTAAHQIVGTYDDGVRLRGFVYDYITGTYTTVEYPDPNIQTTIITGVNSQGVIVGYAAVKDAQGHSVAHLQLHRHTAVTGGR